MPPIIGPSNRAAGKPAALQSSEMSADSPSNAAHRAGTGHDAKAFIPA